MYSDMKFDDTTITEGWRTNHWIQIEELHGGKFEDISPMKLNE